jgi:hypothetical protein
VLFSAEASFSVFILFWLLCSALQECEREIDSCMQFPFPQMTIKENYFILLKKILILYENVVIEVCTDCGFNEREYEVKTSEMGKFQNQKWSF